MSTPLILEARRQWPKARITLLGKPNNCTLLASCPAIDEWHATTALPFSLRGRREMAEVEAWLRGRGFDVAIIALGDEFAGLLAKVGIPIRVGVHQTPLAACLTHVHDIGSPRTWGPWERLGALQALGLEVEYVPPRLWISEANRSNGRQRLVRSGLDSAEPYVVLHPFGSTIAQWWPAKWGNELARSIRVEFGLSTVLVGGPETAGVALNPANDLIDVRGVLSLEELLGVVEQAQLVISTDSGPFHIAGALRRPVVGMFRASRPEHAARYRQANVVFGCHEDCDVECQWNRCGEQPCRQMSRVSPDDVMTAARGSLRQAKEVETSERHGRTNEIPNQDGLIQGPGFDDRRPRRRANDRR